MLVSPPAASLSKYDLLAHNVEAYSGIPNLFFTWTLRQDKRVHFEFLDNSVAQGPRPRTIAFGLNGRMNILDLNCLLDIDRFRNINVEARTPADIYPNSSTRNARAQWTFLRPCAQRMSVITFAEHESCQIYARMTNGSLTWWNRGIFERAVSDPDARTAFATIAMPPQGNSSGTPDDDGNLDPRQNVTLGQ